MNIVHIEYSIKTKSLDIFVSGCNPPYCEGCCNPELIDFDNGRGWMYFHNKIKKYIEDFDNIIENIFLLGGSFNHQDDEQLEDFFYIFKELTNIFENKKIWLFAREDLKDVKSIFKENCQYIKCGEYAPALKCENNIKYGVKLATSNQVIYQKHVNY